MRNIRHFDDFRKNEMFDSEELKTKFEVPYLKGNLIKSFDKVLGDVPNKFADRVSRACPFVVGMKYNNTPSMFSLGLTKVLHNTIMYILIEVMYGNICNIYTSVVKENGILYAKNYSKRDISNFDSLTKFINDKGYKALVDLNKFTKSELGESVSNHLSFKDNPINIRSN